MVLRINVGSDRARKHNGRRDTHRKTNGHAGEAELHAVEDGRMMSQSQERRQDG
jgi:hypothetical protein